MTAEESAGFEKPSTQDAARSRPASPMGPSLDIAPLDPAQVKRIEAVHRGFLYQHLYCVGCLLTVGRHPGASVRVERDEDIEVLHEGRWHYVQVKTRSRPLQPADIGDALTRFDELRRRHVSGERPGQARFLIISSSETGRDVRRMLAAAEWPDDIAVLTPGHSGTDILPPAWADVDEAVRWCAEKAGAVPFGALAPETLVWKLAAKVQHVASQAANAFFAAAEMPVLLEQLVEQLQDFPDPPQRYRPQVNEPPLIGGARARLITGFSGAGKTAWASQAALHCPSAVVYFDVGDLPAASVASGLARELVARFLGGRSQGAGGGIFAHGAGVDVLRACAARMHSENVNVTVVLDNAHRMRAETIRTIVQAAPHVRFVLIAQPWPDAALVEALLSVRVETLSGWSGDDIASEFRSYGAPIRIEDVGIIGRLTGSLPLYVRSAAMLAADTYGGDAHTMCKALASRSHTTTTAQEVILEEVFAQLSEMERRCAAILALSEVALADSEALSLLAVLTGSDSASAAILRSLRKSAILMGFQGDRLGVHDALRPLAADAQALLDDEQVLAAERKLLELLMGSLRKNRNIPRLSAVLRLLPKVGLSNALVDLATDEMFHEQGDPRELRVELENAASDQQNSASNRFWAHDALAYWESRDGGSPDGARLRMMASLIELGRLGRREKLALIFKEMALAGRSGNRSELEAAFKRGLASVETGSIELRLLRYNRFVGLHRLGDHLAISQQIEPLIDEYYADIGIAESDVFMMSNKELHDLLPAPVDQENLKRLADVLSLWCQSQIATGRRPFRVRPGEPPALRRIHAMKFYHLAGAIRSTVVTAQEAVDDFLQIHSDPVGARQIMEQHALPFVAEAHLTDMLIPVRSHFAIVLAWCGDIQEARREMSMLREYGGTPEQRLMLQERAEMIEAVASGRARLGDEERSRRVFSLLKTGRNEPCLCGSGRKYKRCHGAD